MAKKRSTQPARARRPKTLPSWAIFELGNALVAVKAERFDAARAALETIDARCPNRPEVLELLLEVCIAQEDTVRMQRVCRQLLARTPDEPALYLILAQSYLLNGHPALAVSTIENYLARFPWHDEAAQAREHLETMRAYAAATMTGSGLSLEGDDREEAILHEEINVLMNEGDLKDARAALGRLLELRPTFTPALNNLSTLLWLDGKDEDAITTAWRALESAPDNIHALANLVIYCFKSGREADARTWAARLKASKAGGFDVPYKKCEAFSYLGDDAAILKTFEAARKIGKEQSPGADAATAHLAACAAWRLGRESEARKWWREAMADGANPMASVAQENLDDLKKPLGERHAPWAFGLQNWIRESVVRDWQKLVKNSLARPGSRQDEPLDADPLLRRAIEKYVAEHAFLEALAPVLLARGDAPGRAFALLLARTARTPKLLEALREFVLSQNGPDALRVEAAQVAREAGVLAPGPDGMVRLWVQGEWRELLMMGFEVHGEPQRRFSRSMENLVAKALEHLRHDDGVAAEMLLQEALTEYPDDPSLLNNLARSYEIQGRREEALRLTEEIMARHPDYVFARATLARVAVDDGDLKRAEALLQPLWQKQRLHFTEMAAWFAAQIELFLAQGNPDAARSWLAMWEQADPDAPALAGLRKRLRALTPTSRKTRAG
ncbi:MAG TPA: tetratricopeptide repeat protein [Abditibacteriaceae bacterium]|nr:tetratricopeptide repeat protein [Abditibacteriaceae bacterium]